MVRALKKNHPANRFLLFSVLLVVTLYYGRELLVPLVFAAFCAMLMAPVCRNLENKKINRTFSVIICVFILVVVLLGIFAVIVGEVTTFITDLPAIQKKILDMINEMSAFVQERFNMPRLRQAEIVKQQVDAIGQSTGTYFGRLIQGISSTLGGLVLTVIYTFLLLYHKEKYETFFLKLYEDHDASRIQSILDEVTTVGQKYLLGRAISIIFLWIIYTIALLLFGIKSAVLLAAIAALLSIIPYVGSILGSVFPFMMALLTKDVITALWVAVALFILHALGTYFIEPFVIGRKVKLSAMAMLVGIIAGGILWGISGMILFIPILAMAKIVFEYIDSLKPYAYLIGDPDEGATSKIEEWIMKTFSKGKPKTTRRKAKTS